MRVAFSWQNKMALGQATEHPYYDKDSFKDANKIWKHMPQSLGAKHVKLYVGFETFNTYFVVAHRKFVSAYSFILKRWYKTF
jgi:hypothetical protein